MSRKSIVREITATTVELVKIVTSETGEVSVEKLDPQTIIGNADKVQAEKELSERLGEKVVVTSVQADTNKYRMNLVDFIANGELVEEEVQEQQEAEL